MAHYTDSLPVWECFKTTLEGAEIALKIHKLNLGEVLSYLPVKNNKSVLEAMKLPTSDLTREMAEIFTRGGLPAGLPEEVIKEIITRGEAQNFPPHDSTREKASADWLAGLFAALGKIGYKKDDVLALYPAEIPALLRAAQKATLADCIHTALAVNAPKALSEELEALRTPEERHELSDSEYKALEEKYLKGKNHADQ